MENNNPAGILRDPLLRLAPLYIIRRRLRCSQTHCQLCIPLPDNSATFFLQRRGLLHHRNSRDGYLNRHETAGYKLSRYGSMKVRYNVTAEDSLFWSYP